MNKQDTIKLMTFIKANWNRQTMDEETARIWTRIMWDVDYPTAIRVVDELVSKSKPDDSPPNPGYIRTLVRDITERNTRIAEDKDPPINSPEWPWSMPRSVVLARYSQGPNGIHHPGDISWASKDGVLYPCIFGYEEKPYLIRLNRWMITDEEISKRKLSSPDRVYEIIGFRGPEWPRYDEQYDPVPIYEKECERRGVKPDTQTREALAGLWATYRKRHGQREPGEEG